MRFSLAWAAGLLLCLAVSPAFALSDADYAAYKKQSPAFARAEKRMNAAWKKLKKQLPKDKFAELQTEQRAWLLERDPEVASARKAGDTRPPAEIYAEGSLQRALILESRLDPQQQPGKPETPQSQTGSPQGAGKTPAAPAHSLTGNYGGGVISLTPEGDGWSVVVHTIGPQDRWVCDYAGHARLSGDILTFEERGGVTPIRVYVRDDTLIISPDLNPGVSLTKFCGSGGDFFGEYAKDR